MASKLSWQSWLSHSPSQHNAESSNNTNTNQISMSGDFGCNIAALQKPTKMGTEHFKGDSFRILSCLQVSQMRQASECRVLC